ncbi:hypothetical protein [Halalkalibacter alkalisediminis]|uniref:Uncharacterized protein n=1 Tax=Halalkalibacter alkalisediminis TaxID=935616 RepID=A0ABV6NG46_9BACI|nr:hypothetical protein [Halalkalibacter alkalisediminis]
MEDAEDEITKEENQQLGMEMIRLEEMDSLKSIDYQDFTYAINTVELYKQARTYDSSRSGYYSCSFGNEKEVVVLDEVCGNNLKIL